MEQENLHSLREQVARQAQLRSRERSLKSQLPALKAREEELAAARSKEQTDVDKLEGGSLKAYFLRFTGGLEDRLDQERAEAAQAAVRHDMVCRELASVQADLESAQAELASLAGCEERYRAALEEKTRQLQDAGGPMGERLRELEARTRGLAGQLRELREALEAGETARATADRIRSSLDSAEGWGTWDLLGGGLLTDLAKHDHLDEAQRQVETPPGPAGAGFRTELADVEIQADMQVGIDGFLRFADFFFDGLFADWAVLDHIHDAQQQVEGTRDQIDSVLIRLRTMEQDTVRELAEVEAERERLLTPGIMRRSFFLPLLRKATEGPLRSHHTYGKSARRDFLRALYFI